MRRFEQEMPPDVVAAVKKFDELLADTNERATAANLCFCTDPIGLHWFNSDRCIDCRCPGFSPVESSTAAESGNPAREHEERALP